MTDKLFQMWCICADGKEIKVGSPDTEQRIDKFVESQLGCSGEQAGNRYVSRPVNYKHKAGK